MYTDELTILVSRLNDEADTIVSRADNDDDRDQADKAYRLADDIRDMCDELDAKINGFLS